MESLSELAEKMGAIPSALAHWIGIFSSGAGDAVPKTLGPPTSAPVGKVDSFSHPNASKVTLSYGEHAVKLSANAEQLLKSILASIDMTGAKLTSTLRTYHDQARITMTQTYKASPAKVAQWYGKAVREACEKYLKTDDIQGFADWWEKDDNDRGKVSSRHIKNRALDVVPNGDRVKFAKKVKELISVRGSGVQRIIPKGVMGEPVDHVEFTFPVTDKAN